MTDKEKLMALRAEIERRISSINNRENKISADKVAVIQLEAVLSFYDSMQEEPQVKESAEFQHVNDMCKEKDNSLTQETVSNVWHDMSEEAENGRNIIIIDPKDFYGAVLRRGGSQLKNHNKERYVKWAYIDDIINITNREEPVSEDLEEAAVEAFKQIVDSDKNNFLEIFKAGANWQQEKEYTCYEEAFEDGAKWKVENLWKPADGDDLPEINREVIALLDNGKVGFAHRPPEYWDGKNIVTGKVTRNYPKTYDKGGWNIPDVKWWLDVKFPKEIEL